MLAQGPELSLMEASASTRSPSRSCCGRWPRRTPRLHRVAGRRRPGGRGGGGRRSPHSTATLAATGLAADFAAERAWLAGHAPPAGSPAVCHGDLQPAAMRLDGDDTTTTMLVNWSRGPGRRRRVRRRPHAPDVLVGALPRRGPGPAQDAEDGARHDHRRLPRGLRGGRRVGPARRGRGCATGAPSTPSRWSVRAGGGRAAGRTGRRRGTRWGSSSTGPRTARTSAAASPGSPEGGD